MDEKVPVTRDPSLLGRTYKIVTGCGNVYVTVNRNADGEILEVFGKIGKAGGCAASNMEGCGRLISRSRRYGVPVSVIVKDLRGIRCHTPHWDHGKEVTSCMDAVAIAIEEDVAWEESDEFKKIYGRNTPE